MNDNYGYKDKIMKVKKVTIKEIKDNSILLALHESTSLALQTMMITKSWDLI